MSETRELLEGFLGGTKPITEVGTGRKYYLNPQTEEKYYLLIVWIIVGTKTLIFFWLDIIKLAVNAV